jgi:hypothetical protein
MSKTTWSTILFKLRENKELFGTWNEAHCRKKQSGRMKRDEDQTNFLN